MHHTAGVGSPSIARIAVCRIPVCLLLVCLFLVCLFLAALAPAAWAHGGRFIPPPPPLGPPPPPMIPVIPPPTPPGLGGPGPVTPPVALPPMGTPGTLPGGGGGSPFAPRARRAVPQADPNARWQTWWNLNRLAFLPDRDAVHRRTAVTPRPGETPDEGFWAKKRLEVGGVQVLPFLLGLVDPEAGTRDDLKASALLALGKIARDEAVVRVLLRELAQEHNAQLVRESAALALGLIRRSEPALAFDPIFLDEVRQRLLDTAANARAPVRTRAFAVLAVGLLGDQAFGTPYTKDGRLVIRTLWQRLGQAHAQRDVPIALLTALGLQPAAGVPDGVREGLRRIVSGKSVHGRRWDSVERGHALATALRLGGPDRQALLLRVLRRAREKRDVKRAAYLALGVLADTMTPLERRETAKAVLESLRRDRDPLSRGLGQLGLGHLLGADLRVGETGVLAVAGAGRKLLSEARSGSSTTRSFSVLGLALALRGGKSDERVIASFLGEARRVLSEPLEKTRGDASILSAHAVAVGLAGIAEAREDLQRIVTDRNAQSELRGHAAVALGQLGGQVPEVERTLSLALADPRDLDLRRQAALGLALVGGRTAAVQLMRQLKTGRTERLLAQVVVALGRLGDLDATVAIQSLASDEKHSELARSLAVVALGLLLDPEPRPSLLRLTAGSFYPARTDALDEAFTIL